MGDDSSSRPQNQTRLIPFPIHIPDNRVAAARYANACRITEISPLRGRSARLAAFLFPFATGEHDRDAARPLIPGILFGFTGLIGIINPFGMAFVFLERTQSLTEAERAVLSKQLATNVFFTLLAIFFVGAPVLNFFGI